MSKKVLTSKTELEEILTIAPEWRKFLDRIGSKKSNSDRREGATIGKPKLYDLLAEVGAKPIYSKVVSLKEDQKKFLTILRDFYYQPMFAKMLSSNQNLRRFHIARRVSPDTQKQLSVSMSVDLAQKMSAALEKQIAESKEDGFKVLLPAYGQRSVHNAVVDYVRNEWQWEKDTLQDLNLDPNQADPRTSVADDIEYSPEQQAISGEQVGQLNMVRTQLAAMIGDETYPQDALAVVDCMFGLGLTPNSKSGVEMTMRETTEVLNLKGDTQARKIARCQVLLDKGLDLIRDSIRTSMPGIAHAWQADMNVNSASRRELNHQLGLTEGEVDRLLKNRQFYSMDELVDRKVVKPERLPELTERGAVAAFVPVDINSATRRDIIDITGADKDAAKKIVDRRPFANLNQLVELKIVDKSTLAKLIGNGAVAKEPPQSEQGYKRININQADRAALKELGLSDKQSERLLRARPFDTWGELEDFLCLEPAAWQRFRQRGCLSISPS